MDKNSKVQELKNKVNEKTKSLKENVTKKEEKRTEKPILTARILFISVLNIIYVIFLVLLLIVGLVQINWNPKEMLFDFAGFIVIYLILNWFYRCLSRTILCLTNKRIYMEMHLPFYYNEITIPVEKVTKVEVVNVFWIFKTLIVHQYGALPMIFPTWDANKFKDKLEEMITFENYRVENKYENSNLLSNTVLKYLVCAFVALIIIGCIVTGVRKLNNPTKKLVGTYVKDDYKVILEKDGTCDITGIEELINKKDPKECTWTIEDDSKESLTLKYKYTYKGYYQSYEYSGSTYLVFNTKDKTLTYNDIVLKKK